MNTRKRSRQTAVLASLATCCYPIATAATTPVDPFSWSMAPSITTSNGLPKNSLRNHEDKSWWNEDATAGGSDDGNETESNSDDNDDEFQDRGPRIDGAFETTSISYSTVPGSSVDSSSPKRRNSENKGSKKHEKTDRRDNNVNSASYQSMKTLDRLQQMLDDTDYITKPRLNPTAQKATPEMPIPLTHSQAMTKVTNDRKDSLWTSKDRSKYKKQQRKMINQTQNRFQEQMRHQQFQEPVRKASTSSNPYRPPASGRPHVHHQPVSDDDLSEDSEDALGYTLPNLPVYFSDAEGESETEVDTALPPPESNMYGDGYPTSTSYTPSYGMERQHYFDPSFHPGYSTNQYQHQQHPQQMFHNPQSHAPQNYPYAYPSQNVGSETLPYQRYDGNGVAINPSHYPDNGSMPLWNQQYQYPQQWTSPVGDQARGAPPPQTSNVHFHHPQSSFRQPSATTTFPLGNPHSATEMGHLSTVALTRQTNSGSLNGRSVQQISLLLAAGSFACFVAVSPRTLPFDEYRLRITENMRIVSLALIFPSIVMALVYDGNRNNLNDVINTFFASCSVGYTMAFASEVLLATFIRLAVFSFLEKGIFNLSPRIPIFILPWVLRENEYRPKRITLFVADFLTSCVASPVVEEYVKLKVLLWSSSLPRNFDWLKKSVNSKRSQHGKKTELVAEQVLRPPGEVDVVNANQYVTHMLAASLGLKLFDSIRRILLYTKPHQESKSFFSFCRGVFPIHELCGTMTALGLAKRDLLGVAMPLWKILLPSVVVHGMANFRGMKPIFKWNSSTPWSEMQLYPLAVDSKTSLLHLLKKAYPKLVWLVILSRVFGYCVKNYFMVNRHARKRATTYAGKHAAFSAELATAELLKKK